MVPEFRQLLEDGDVDGLWQAWGRIAPHLPQPKSREDAEVSMHMARTAARSIPEAYRVYSHRWLTERGYPSQLPGEMLPKIVEAVGISVNFRSGLFASAATAVRCSMETAVEDCFANGDRAPEIVRKQMFAARDREMRSLFGRR